MSEKYDAIIIGGGPAGISAALTLRQRDKSVAVVANPPDTTNLWKAKDVGNYPGIAGTGESIQREMIKQLAFSGAVTIAGRALSVVPMGASFGVAVGNDYYEAAAVILAAGITRENAYPGENDYLGRGVSYCATCDGMLYRGKRVAVLGFADSARQEASFLESIGCSVIYFDRPRTCSIAGGDQVERVTCDGKTEAVSGVFLLRPTMAPTDLFPELAVEGGYVKVDRKMATNLPGVFAAGDCTGGPLQVAKAVGEGLIAGQSAAAFAAAQGK